MSGKASARLRVVGGSAQPQMIRFGSPEYKAALEASLKSAKHIGDEMRAGILARDWSRVHIAGDRAPALHLPVGWRAPR